MIQFDYENMNFVKIRVMGVGGGGSNAVNRMLQTRLKGVDFLAVNTDLQALRMSAAPERLQIGEKLTKGLGAGSNPEVGAKAAQESVDQISEALKGTDILFLTAGFGGGTGTGATPVIAKIARDMEILTIAVITKPFTFEGSRRALQAYEGIKVLRESCDTIICIPNDRLLEYTTVETSLLSAFHLIDDILSQSIQSISNLLIKPGLINLDFADVRTILAEKGGTLLGFGEGTGRNKAVLAAEAALRSPLFERKGVQGAKGILLSVMGGPDLSLHEVNQAVSLIHEIAHQDAHIIFGATIDTEYHDRALVTVIATGLEIEDAAPVVRVMKPPITEMKEVKHEQTVIKFSQNDRGQFSKMEGTIINGEDLDIPTFIRRRKTNIPDLEGQQN